MPFNIVMARFMHRERGQALEVPPYDWNDSTLYRTTWAFLDQHQRPEDLAEATRVLRSSPYVYDRVGALALLPGFVGEDAAWHALAGALLEPEGPVQQEAFRLLALFARSAARPVNWAPAAEDLRAILDGSYLAGLHTVLDILVRTEIAPALAPALLKGGGHAVLMYAGAEQAALREPALAFLRRTSGKDFGRDLVRWEAWIAGL